MKIRNLRWFIVTLVAVATVINYVDRNALALMWTEISADLGMDKNDYALIVNFFMVGYAIGQSLFGRIFDKIGTRFAFVLAIVVWSVSIMLHAAARGVMSFGVFRFILGVSEAGNWPGATKCNAEWFPIKERALAQGIFNSGASIGSIVSPLIILVLFLQFGWMGTFIVVGALGLLWLIPWLLLYKAPPKEHPWLSEAEREYILSGQKAPVAEGAGDQEQAAPGWLEMLRYRQSWSVIASRFFLDPIWWLFVSWLPIYLAEQFGFDVRQIAYFAWVPYVGAAVGALFGGWLANVLLRSGWTVNRTRKLTITLGGGLMLPALIATAFAATPLTAVLLIAVILFGFQVAIGNIQTLPSDFFSDRSVGSLAGVGGTAAVVGVIVMNWLVPVLSETSYVPVFILGALLVPLALLSVWGFGGRIGPLASKHSS